MYIISEKTAQRLRHGWATWQRDRFYTGRATALAWIEHGDASPAQVHRLGAAAAAGLFADVEELTEPTTAWQWIVGTRGDLPPSDREASEEADRFWESLGVSYDEYFAAGFMAGVRDVYRQVFHP